MPDEDNVLRPGGIVPIDVIDHATPEDIEWLTASNLAVIVVGASGDLAKKKTYPVSLSPSSTCHQSLSFVHSVTFIPPCFAVASQPLR